MQKISLKKALTSSLGLGRDFEVNFRHRDDRMVSFDNLSAQIGLVLYLDFELNSSFLDFGAGLDFIILEAAAIAIKRHYDHFPVVGNLGQ